MKIFKNRFDARILCNSWISLTRWTISVYRWLVDSCHISARFIRDLLIVFSYVLCKTWTNVNWKALSRAHTSAKANNRLKLVSFIFIEFARWRTLHGGDNGCLAVSHFVSPTESQRVVVCRFQFDKDIRSVINYNFYLYWTQTSQFVVRP